MPVFVQSFSPDDPGAELSSLPFCRWSLNTSRVVISLEIAWLGSNGAVSILVLLPAERSSHFLDDQGPESSFPPRWEAVETMLWNATQKPESWYSDSWKNQCYLFWRLETWGSMEVKLDLMCWVGQALEGGFSCCAVGLWEHLSTSLCHLYTL